MRNELNERITVVEHLQAQKAAEHESAAFEYQEKVARLEIDLLELRAEIEQAKEEAQGRIEDLEVIVADLLENEEEE